VIEGGDRCERTGAGGWWDQVVAVLLGRTMLAVAPAEHEMAHAAPPAAYSAVDLGPWCLDVFGSQEDQGAVTGRS
jgi:hypothetical protein